MADNFHLVQPSFPRPAGMAWLKNHCVLDTTTGKPLALIGTAFLEAVQLHNPAVLAQFGINTAWFGRYFAAGVTPPTVFAEDTLHTRTNSLIGLKVLLNEGYTQPPTWETDLKTHLLTALKARYPEASIPEEKHIKIQVTHLCCEKACYGCLDSTIANSQPSLAVTDKRPTIQRSGNNTTTPWLNLIA
jgi:hypothetical protein